MLCKEANLINSRCGLSTMYVCRYNIMLMHDGICIGLILIEVI